MIETPAAAVTVTNKAGAPANKEEAERLLDEPSVEVAIHPVRPITSKIRTTIRHVTSQTGFFGRWRGIVPAFVYSFMKLFWSGMLVQKLPMFPGQNFFVSVIVSVALANIHMAYLHAVISLPTSQRWYQRLGDLKTFKALTAPHAFAVTAAYIVIWLTASAVALAGLGNAALYASDADPTYSYACMPLSLLAVVLFGITLTVFIYIPAVVSVIRVEASLLPDEHETIVPFDRSFGGLVVPAILGGSGAISFSDAWKTFNGEARRRVIKLYAKIFLVIATLFFVMVGVLSAQFWSFAGDEVRRAINQNDGQLPGFEVLTN